eukprot:67954_1
MTLFVIVLTLLFIYSVQSLINCNTPTDCTTAINVAEGVFLKGYQSGKLTGSITTSGSAEIKCWGSQSCIVTPLSGYNLYARGTQSAYNSSLIIARDWVSCEGSNACSYSNIQAGSDVMCKGDQACSHSTISLTISGAKINGRGAYSLKNSTIHSIDGIIVNLYGYHSGFGARILCQNSHSCTINCYGNSCDYLMECLNCNINYYHQPDAESLTDILLFDYWTNNNNIKCEQIGSIQYDDFQELYQEPDYTVNDNVPALCCRGGESCKHTNIEYNGTLICSGFKSCEGSVDLTDFIKNYKGDIFCEGYWSCTDRMIYSYSQNVVYCSGSISCQGSSFISAGTIYCTGLHSCRESVITSIGDGTNLTVYFLGSNSMQSTVINCRHNDICHIVQDVVNENEAAEIYCDGQCVLECPYNYNCPILFINQTTGNPTTDNPTTNSTFQPTILPT